MMRSYLSWGLFRGSRWDVLYHGNPSAATPMEEVCGPQGGGGGVDLKKKVNHIWSNSTIVSYTGWPKKNGTVDFLGLCSDQQLSFFTLLDRTSCSHYNNTKIIKFGWKLVILWVISYGLSFSGFTINFSLVGGPPKNGTVNLLGLCSDEQLFLSPCWIEHLFLIIHQDHQIWLKTFYFMSNFLSTVIFGICH